VRQTASGLGVDAPLESLKGIGPQRARLLERKGLRTIEDGLFFFPSRHEDRTRLTPLAKLQIGEAQTCSGVIVGLSPPPPGRSRAPFAVMLRDQSGYATAVWFGGRYLARVLKRGQRLVLHGRVARFMGAVTIQQPDFEIVESNGNERLHTGRLVPVYSLTEGLTQRPLRALMWRLVDRFARQVPETLPDTMRARRSLMGLSEALRNAHFPANGALLTRARGRLVFDEFLFLELGLPVLRSRLARVRGIAMAPPGQLVERLRASLPYTLTGAQDRVWAEIRRDMAKASPMHRLLQGDVGSGKTVVAALAVLTAIEAGYQAAVMAPTEILAEQHFVTFRDFLEPLGVPVTLLTSALPSRERARRRAALADGDLPSVVGTHALVQEGVEFRRLGLAVVDEQHRFGVEQRARLRSKGESPHLLVMTATPIPRTLALTLYGDLDVSLLDELPPGRRPVVTVVRTESKRAEIYEFLRTQIRDGRQVYVVYPLIDDSETLDLRAATDMARHLGRDVFPDFTVGLLHGRLPLSEKETIMRRFKGGEIHILVSTTVIEVGIDMPNASVMLVEHAERFGLSQLHQLRGRVGRGPWKAYCILLTGDAASEDARRRLAAMGETNDGFRSLRSISNCGGPANSSGRGSQGYRSSASPICCGTV